MPDDKKLIEMLMTSVEQQGAAILAIITAIEELNRKVESLIVFQTNSSNQPRH